MSRVIRKFQSHTDGAADSCAVVLRLGFAVFAVGVFAVFAGVGCSNAVAQYAGAEPVPNDLQPGFESISVEQSKEWLSVIAGPEMNGRGTGQPGYSKAAKFVAEKLKEFGVEPKGDNGTYFQNLPMTRRVPLIDQCRILGPGFQVPGKGNLGFERYTDRGQVVGEAVLLVFGRDSKNLPNELSLRDKLVFYVADESAATSAPVTIAKKRPAAAIRIIDGVPGSISQLVQYGKATRSTSVSGTIRREAAVAMFGRLGVQPNVMRARADGRTFIQPTGQSLTIQMRIVDQPATVPNVVGWLPGSDPNLQHEYIVMGAHLDHLGVKAGFVFPGADDNGSGSTALMSVARAMTLNPVRPKRSVLFMWFAAEEIGLIGSKYYCDHPVLPLQNMTSMLNIDMVGRNEESSTERADDNVDSIHLIGSQKGQTELHQLIQDANRHIGFRFEYDEESIFDRSDQYNFYAKGVPVSFLFGGFHPDYHEPTDSIEKINFQKLISAARLYYVAAFLVAEHGRFQVLRE